jgi:ribosomal protein S18 acetylase RimI-like enzyme
MSPDGRRLEELSLNSSAPPGQLLYDGWLLRLAAGKAKRARSVNAVYPSTRPLEEKIAYCEALYARAGLPAIFRLTPFVHPADLDVALEQRGYGRFDETAVECAEIGELPPSAARLMELAPWVEAVGDLRGSPAEHRATHHARLAGMPLQLRPMAIEQGGGIVATGLAVVEGDCVGLFDIVTHAQARRQGHARTLVAGLLGAARELGARHAYLQVQGDNDPARRLYRDFGFEERYLYWYRGREGEQE